MFSGLGGLGFSSRGLGVYLEVYVQENIWEVI